MLTNIKNIEVHSKLTIETSSPDNLQFIFIEEGNLEISVNPDENSIFSSGILYFNSKNYSQLTVSSTDSKIWILEIDHLLTSDFLLDINGISKQYDFVKLGYEKCFINVLSLCKMIKFEADQNNINTKITSQLLGSIIAIYNSEIIKSKGDFRPNNTSNNIIVNNLIDLIEKNYKLNQSVEFYANNLYISTRYLNTLSRKYFNTSLNILIIKRKINEAKIYLKESVLQINEIGYELGFKEKSYFTRVFKSNTGVSPKNFRDKYAKESL